MLGEGEREGEKEGKKRWREVGENTATEWPGGEVPSEARDGPDRGFGRYRWPVNTCDQNRSAANRTRSLAMPWSI